MTYIVSSGTLNPTIPYYTIRSATTLIEANALPLSQTASRYYVFIETTLLILSHPETPYHVLKFNDRLAD